VHCGKARTACYEHDNKQRQHSVKYSYHRGTLPVITEPNLIIDAQYHITA
jgi:hypothetical protein